MKYIYYNMLIWLLASCSFLEEYSQDTVYVRGYQDLEELLVGEGYMSAYAANSLAYQWGYYPYIHYMQDETEECSSDFVNSDYSRKDQIFGIIRGNNVAASTNKVHPGPTKAATGRNFIIM